MTLEQINKRLAPLNRWLGRLSNGKITVWRIDRGAAGGDDKYVELRRVGKFDDEQTAEQAARQS